MEDERREMEGEPQETSPLRAFVRGAWRLLLLQLAVAVLVFGFLATAATRLHSMTTETDKRRGELDRLRAEQTDLRQTLSSVRSEVERKSDALAAVKDALNASYTGRSADAIGQYEKAASLDPRNWFITDLLSNSQYMAGRDALRAGQPDGAMKYFADAVDSVQRTIREQPDYIGAYVRLATYECARDRPDAAVQAYDEALVRRPDAKDAFAIRVEQFPKNCSALLDRIAAR